MDYARLGFRVSACAALVGMAAGCSSSDGARSGSFADGGVSSASDAGTAAAPPTGNGGGNNAAAFGNAGTGGAAPDRAAPEGAAQTFVSDAGVAPSPDASVPESADAGADASVDRCARREDKEQVVKHLSADDSNSMASPVIARRLIRTGAAERWPRPSRWLRTYEFLNYYNVRYEYPEPGHVTVRPEMRMGEDEREFVMQIGAQAAPASGSVSKVITLVLDTSGSMQGRPMQLSRAAVRAIASSLQAGDIVSVVEWNTQNAVTLDGYEVSGPDDEEIASLADGLDAGGGTNLHSGLVHGYDLAQEYYDPGKLNRVVLISDGRANAGVTDKDLIAKHAKDSEQAGIYLSGVGVGEGFNDRLMDAVTDEGRGAYLYLDNQAEAHRMFGDRFDEVMKVGLMNVRVKLTLPWHMAVREFHGEQISSNPQEVRPQHLAPGDAMVFHQVLETCDAEAWSMDDPVDVEARYIRPEGREMATESYSTTFGELIDAPDVGLARGDAIVAYAEALKDAGEHKRKGNVGDAREALQDALDKVEQADPQGDDPGLSEIATLLERYIEAL